MPTLIVLFFDAESGADALVEAAAEGATGVRFTEVDLREAAVHRASSSAWHKSLDSSVQVRNYDDVIPALPAPNDRGRATNDRGRAADDGGWATTPQTRP